MQDERRQLLKNAMKADPDGVVDLILALESAVARLTATVEALERRIEELEARLKMNSRNSSKPPSSDGPKRPRTRSLRRKSGRGSGGQKGHKGHRLEPSEKADRREELKLQACPFTGERLDDSHIVGSVKRQVFELPPLGLFVTEYESFVYKVASTGAEVPPPFPNRSIPPRSTGSVSALGLSIWPTASSSPCGGYGRCAGTSSASA